MKTNKKAFCVITGGPGVGKTSLINELNSYGFQTIPEDARRIIKEQIEINSEGLPWKNKELYARLMLEASLRRYDEVNTRAFSNFIFFDRGILDTICYMKMEHIPVSNEIIEVAARRPYNSNVFILPPWQEIYETDNERKQSWGEAVFTFKKMKETYLDFGYNFIEVPKTTVKQRAEFIIQNADKL
ncbi:AAA family ATPase [Niabella aquatica]